MIAQELIRRIIRGSPFHSLAQALEKGQASHCLSFVGEPLQQAQVLYALWLGANLQAKISRSATPLENALAHVQNIITTPAV